MADQATSKYSVNGSLCRNATFHMLICYCQNSGSSFLASRIPHIVRRRYSKVEKNSQGTASSILLVSNLCCFPFVTRERTDVTGGWVN